MMKFLEDMTEEEFRQFILEGVKDIEEGRVLDFDTVFDELEERYKSN